MAAAPRKTTKKSAAGIEVPNIPGTICFSYAVAKPFIDTIKKVTEIVPKGTGESDANVLLQTTEDGLKLTYGHFGYGACVEIPAQTGGVEIYKSLPLDILVNMKGADLVKLSLIQEGDALAVQSGNVRLHVLLDPPDAVERQIPDFLEDCFDSFSLSDEQFSGLLRQVVFKSTDISVKGSGLPIQIKSDATNGCYYVVARDSAFGVIKTLAADVEADVDVTLAHPFLKVVSDTMGKTESVGFAFSEDMGSCRARIGDKKTVWTPVPIYEEYDILTWRTNTQQTGDVLAELNLPFNMWLGALEDIVPHFALDDQTNNITISFDESKAPPELKMVFTSNRVAVAGRVPYQLVREIKESETVTDGKRMAQFLRCGKQTEEQTANLKLIGNHLFINIPESRLEFILPLR